MVYWLTWKVVNSYILYRLVIYRDDKAKIISFSNIRAKLHTPGYLVIFTRPKAYDLIGEKGSIELRIIVNYFNNNGEERARIKL